MEPVWGQTLPAEQGPGQPGVDIKGQAGTSRAVGKPIQMGSPELGQGGPGQPSHMVLDASLLPAAHFSELPLPSRGLSPRYRV